MDNKQVMDIVNAPVGEQELQTPADGEESIRQKHLLAMEFSRQEGIALPIIRG